MATRFKNVRLASFSVEGYRSLRSVSFKPNSTFSVLIGPNGAGKTNILQAIRLLALPATSRYVGMMPEESTSTKSSIAAEFLIQRKPVGYRSEIVLARSETNNDVVVKAIEQWNLDAALGTKKGWQEYPRFIFEDEYRRLMMLRRRNPGRRVNRNLADPFINQEEEKILQQVFRFTSSIQYYSASQFTNPSRCPSSFEIEENERIVDTLRNRGPQLSFLGDLYRLSKDSPFEYQTYIEFVGKSGISLINKIVWKQIELSSGSVEVKSGGKIVKRRKKRILIVPLVYIGQAHLSFNQLSEGTFRILALVFYLLTSKANLLLIEEPEISVHHGLLTSVIEAIKGQSVRKQIIVSTHSELVLNMVSPENVFATTYGVSKGTSVLELSRALSMKDYAGLKEYLRTVGSLGEYWARGGLQ